MKQITLALFLIACTAEIVAQVYGLTTLHHFSKPALMPLLCFYYLVSVSKEMRSITVVLALLFSFLGDSFLMYERNHPRYFMLGLGAFLLAHIFYILAFRQHRNTGGEHDQLETVQKARMAFPVILAATGLVVVLLPKLGALKIPVIAYAGVLMFMVLNAQFRFRKTSVSSFWTGFAGAALFMLSDSILAINKFLEPVSYAGVVIMITYLAGQFLIVRALLLHEDR